MILSSSRSVVAVTLGLAVGPAAAASQACIGVPTRADQVTLSVGSEFEDGLSLLGGTISANTGSSLSLGIGFYSARRVEPLQSAHFVRATAALERRALGIQICPLLAAASSAGSVRNALGLSSGSLSDARLELGLGIGDEFFRTGSMVLSWHAVPVVLLERSELTGRAPGAEGEGRELRSVDGSVALESSLGLALGVGPLVTSGQARFRPRSQGGTVLGLSVGLAF